ncbi:MAG: hypothetical protein M9894_09895 [Planctomycetes bacterium]|nr:hypothetical protein [Planctomycetota bacterium]
MLTLIMLFLLAALVATLATSVQAQAQSAVQGRELGASLVAADDALARGKARLVWEFAHNYRGQQPDLKAMTPGAAHPAWLTTPEGTVVDIACARVGEDFLDFLLTARSSGPAPRELEMVVRIRYQLTTVPRLRGGADGCLVAFGPVTVTGNFEIDGRDHPAHDPYTVLAGTGSPGITATGRVTLQGSSVAVGGTADGVDHTPASRGTAKDGEHYDAQTTVWSEPDAEGNVRGVPDSADAYFGLQHGDLKAAAQASGTYFTDLAAYNAFARSEGGAAAAGKIVYLEVPNGSKLETLELPRNPAPEHKPAVVVVAGQDPTRHDVQVGPVHCNNGIYQGVLLADRIMNMNGNGALIGQVVTFTDTGPSVGSGTFNLYFSNEVLTNLPRTDGGVGGDLPTGVEPVVLMWREAAAR